MFVVFLLAIWFIIKFRFPPNKSMTSIKFKAFNLRNIVYENR